MSTGVNENSEDTQTKARNIFNITIDESFDESIDPDYTVSHTTVLNDKDDSDINSDSDPELDSYSDLEDDDENISQLSSDIESSQTNPPTDPKSSTVSLPIHQKFYSLIHKNEIPRKLFHLSIGFITLYLHINNYKTKDFWPKVSYAISIIFLLDLLRFNWPYFNNLYCSTVGFLMREKEINSINGVIWFQLGSIICFYYNKQDVAIMAILLLSWSDTAASTIGRKFGYLSPKISKNKSLVGSIAAFFTGIFSCYLFYGIITPLYPNLNIDFEYNQSTNHLNLLTLSLLSGFIAALSEAIDIAGLDDNLTIPVISSFFLSAVIKLGK
jgi:diacylglycerol kinase (CTP)